MRWNLSSLLLAGTVFLNSTASPVLASRAAIEKPYLSDDLQQKLQSLPYGLTDQLSLFLRYRHVNTVQFYGAGIPSRFSFKRGQSVMTEGLSMRLVQNGKASWASGVIQLKAPVDATKYNSVVVWAWASKPNTRVWVGIKGGGLARSDALPKQGLPVNEPVQLVVPFSRMSPMRRVNLKRITQLALEFGQDTTGTQTNAPLQILGVAFVLQNEPSDRALMVLGRSSTRVVLAEPFITDQPEGSEEPLTVRIPQRRVVPQPVTPPLTAMGQMVQRFLKMSEHEMTGFYRQMGFESAIARNYANRHPLPSADAPENTSREWIQPYTRAWPAGASDTDASKETSAPSPFSWQQIQWTPWDGLCAILLIGLLGFWMVLIRRRRNEPFQEQFGKILHEIHWPFSITQPVLHKKVEREFWKGMAAQQERFGWLSTTGLVMEKSSPTEYFGEPFLKRQVELAEEAGITLFPSLSFTNTFFRREASGTTLERTSSALRALVTDTILRFSENAKGVRIENATDFLAARLRRRGKASYEDDSTRPVDLEFWSDVIRAIRAKHPHFVFLADSAGDQFKQLREVGFDYYENDLLRDTVLYQIRSGKVGDLRAFLTGEAAQHLRRSIYNLNPLIKSTLKREVDRHQNALCALILALIPGVIQHDSSISEELASFMNRLARTSVVRRGRFALLATDTPEVLAFGRWRKKTLLITVANFSAEPKNVMVNLKSVQEGFEMNKLYLFNNALHGATSLRNFVNQPESAGPALALWGQNLRDGGLPLSMPPLGLGLFTVTFTQPLMSTAPSASAAPENESSIALT